MDGNARSPVIFERGPGAAGLAGAQEHPPHGALYRVGTASVQGLLALTLPAMRACIAGSHAQFAYEAYTREVLCCHRDHHDRMKHRRRRGTASNDAPF